MKNTNEMRVELLKNFTVGDLFIIGTDIINPVTVRSIAERMNLIDWMYAMRDGALRLSKEGRYIA